MNAFINSASDLDAPSLNASAFAVLSNVEDEACQLGTLSTFLSGVSDAATCAINDLPDIYSTIEWSLNQIIADPSDETYISSALEDINAYRCCNVLPYTDILWVDAAGVAGINGQVPVVAGRANVCAEIDCSDYLSLDDSQCRSKYNKGLGM